MKPSSDDILRLARGLALAALILLCLAPVFSALMLAVGPGESFPFFGARQQRLLFSTVLMALGATAVATGLGGGLAIALGYYQPRGARLLLALAVLPLFLPPYLIAMAWVEVFGIQSVLLPPLPGEAGAALLSLRGHGASAVVLGLCYAPVVMLAVLAALRRHDQAQDEAARMHAGEWTVLWRVVLPQLRGAAGVGAAVVFFLAALNLSVPSLLQAPVYSVEVYTWFNMQASPRMAILQSLPLTAAALPAMLGGLIWLARPQTAGPGGAQRGNVPLRRARGARRGAAVAAIVALGLLVGLPLAVLTWRAWPLHALLEAWGMAWEEYAVSFLLAGATAGACAVLAALLSVGTGRMGRVALALGALPLAVAGPVFAVGFIHFWNHHGVRGAVYDGPLALLFVSVGRYVGWALLGAWLGALSFPRELAEAARGLGAGRARVLLRIQLPALSPTLLGTALLVFVLALGEVDAVLLTAPPGTTPLSVRIYALMHYGSGAQVAAMGLMLMLTALPCVLAALWLLMRQPSSHR